MDFPQRRSLLQETQVLVLGFLQTNALNEGLQLDLGDRSLECVTKAVCIAVSESSVVRIFCHGRLVGEIIPELWMVEHAPLLRGKVKKEEVGELTVLKPNSGPASTAT